MKNMKIKLITNFFRILKINNIELWATLAVVVISILITACSSTSENPFRDRKFLLAKLREVKFYDAHVYSYDKDGNLPTRKEVPYKENILQIESLLGHYVSIGAIDVESDHDSAPYYKISIADPLPSLAAHENSIVDTQRLRLSNGKLSFIGYTRNLDVYNKDTYVYREWEENNSAFASVEGGYNVINSFNNDVYEYSFKLIAERHPASNDWFLSSYRGVKSQLDDDLMKYNRWITSEGPNLAKKFLNERDRAITVSYNWIRENIFKGYKRRNNIVQAAINNDYYLVNTDFKYFSGSIDDATNYCRGLSANGYKNWMLPSQPRIAQILTGSYFKKWEGMMAVRDTPDRYFFGGMLDAMRSFSNGHNKSHTIVTKDSQDTGGNRQFYVLKLSLGNQGHEYFSGDGIYLSNNVFFTEKTSISPATIICVNENKHDNEDFRVNEK